MSSRLWIIVAIITVIAAIPRIVSLDAFLSPDEPRWEKNTLGFLDGLRGHDINLLYQQPHPGITTQWLAAPTIEQKTWGLKRLPQAIFLSASISLLTLLMIQLWGIWLGTLAGLLLAIDPHLIAHSRVLAMDALLATFILLALIAYLLWQKTQQSKYMFISGVAGALAVLSKLSGATVMIFIVALLIIHLLQQKQRLHFLKTTTWPWVVGGLITTVIILPTTIANFPYVWAGTKAFFAAEHYSQQVHALGPWWYPQAIAIWTTPLQWLGILLLPLGFLRSAKNRKDIVTLLAFLILFLLAVQYSIKKGDRYLLPDFALLNVLIALSLASAWDYLANKRVIRTVLLTLVVVCLLWQVTVDIRLHPYYLAYRNPFTRQLTHDRTMGWGEGLNLAAAYLNGKSDAENMLVISYYEGPFAYHFKGEVTSAERLAKETAQEIGGQYVVLYRAMEGRVENRWETKVLGEYRQKTPEHTILLNGEEYVWIYKVD